MKKMLTGTNGSSRYWLIGILALAFFVRLVVLFGFTDFNSSFSEDPYPQMATYMLDGQGMSKYFENEGVRPVTSHGPLYPLFSAALLLASNRSWLAVRVAQLLLSVASVLLIFHAGRRTLGLTAGLIAALLTAVYMPLIRLSADLMTETLFTFILILVVFLGMRFVEEWRGLLSIWLGVALGLLILTKLKGLFIAVAFLPFLLILGYKRKRPLFWAIVPFLLAVLIYSPWVVRGSLIEHTFLPFGSGFGEAVLSGQEPGDALNSGPNFEDQTAGQRSESRFKQGVDFIKTRPLGFITNAGRHFLNMWFNLGFSESPSTGSILFAMANLISLVFGIAGTFMLLRRAGPGRDLAYLIVTILVTFTAVHLGTLGVGRYSVPLLPLVFLMASWPLAKILGRVQTLGHENRFLSRTVERP